MNRWSGFPARQIERAVPLFRIHQWALHPAWFNNDGSWRFDPSLADRARFGTCYLGLEPMSAYVEVFGRIGKVPQSEIDRRALSEIRSTADLSVADLTDRSVLGDFGVTAAHSTGLDYGPSQALASDLFEGGFDGILYRVRHDPAMLLEGIALFGDPGESPQRFDTHKSVPIPPNLTDAAREFRIEVIPTVELPPFAGHSD